MPGNKQQLYGMIEVINPGDDDDDDDLPHVFHSGGGAVDMIVTRLWTLFLAFCEDRSHQTNATEVKKKKKNTYERTEK